MAKRKKTGDYYDTLRARFDGKSKGRGATGMSEPQFDAPADPSARYFGAHAAPEDEAPARFFDAGSVQEERDDLAAKLDAYGQTETAFTANALRLVVGFVWLALAGAFFLNTANADAPALTKLFATIAAAGIIAAIIGALVAAATGRASNKRITENAASLGTRIALETRALNNTAASRVAPIEAEAFLKSTSFAAPDTGHAASHAAADYAGQAEFQTFLKRSPKTSGHASGAFAIALIGTIALALLFFFATRIDLSGLAIARYPLVFAAIVGGAVLYAGAGLIASLAGGSLRQASLDRIETNALTALRAAYAKTGAPRRALNAGSTASSQPASSRDANQNLGDAIRDQRQNDANLDWRERDSGPRFVETGFQTAPRPFRTDAFSKKFNGP